MSELEHYTLTINGEERQVADAWIGESLLYVLRERLGLPGSKPVNRANAVAARSMSTMLLCAVVSLWLPPRSEHRLPRLKA